MLDVGWSEILVIAIVAILVVGPKELPGMLRTFGRVMSKLRGMASEFRGQFEDALKEADLDDVRKGLASAQKLNPMNSLRDAIDPLRQMGNDIKADLQKATRIETPVTPPKDEPLPTQEPNPVVANTEPVIMPPAPISVPPVMEPPIGAGELLAPVKPARKQASSKVEQARKHAPPRKQKSAPVEALSTMQDTAPAIKPAPKSAGKTAVKKPARTDDE